MSELKMEDLLTDVVATPPTVYHQLQSALDDPKSSFEEYGRIIQADTGLTAHLLKIANSPFYGFEAKVESITHAMSIIGLEQITDLALVALVIDKFRGIPKHLIDMDAFWRHSIACGLCARLIAKHLNEGNTERFYLAGILHDIGNLVFFQQIPVKSRLLLNEARRDQRPLFEIERQVLGFDHSDMGSLLLQKWNLPEVFIEAVRCVHRPEEADQHPRVTAVVHLADCAAYKLNLGHSGEPLKPLPQENALEQAGITPRLYQQVQEETLGQYDFMVDMFLQ